MKVSKDGQTFYDIGDTDDELEAAKAKGYRPYVDVQKDGAAETFTIPAEEIQKASEKGYAPVGGARVLDEPHPAIHLLDRGLVETAANTAEQKVTALKKMYPDMDIKKETGTDRVLVRQKNEPVYHVLSPSFSPISHPLNTLKDLGGQVMDAAWPLASGTATGLAATGGGMLGLSTGGPVGMIASGGTAGAGASAGMEALRQAFGRKVGVIPENSPTDMRKVGAAGVVGGIGGAAQEAAPLAWQGIKNRVLPALGELTSGVPKDVLSTTAQNLPAVDALNSPEAKLELLQGFRSSVKNKMGGLLRGFGEGTKSAVKAADAAGTQVPLEPARAELEGYLAELEQNLAKQPENQETQAGIAETQRVMSRFGFNGNPAGKEAENAFKAGLDDAIQKKTASIAQYFQRAPTESELAEAASAYAKENNGLLSEAAEAGPREAVDPVNARATAQALKKRANAEGGYGAKTGDVLHDQGLRNAARRAAERLEDGLAEATGGAFTKNQAGYSRTAQDSKVLQQALFGKKYQGSDTLLAGRLSNLPNPAKTPDLAWMRGMDQQYGTGVEDTANLFRANKFMGKPSLLPISAGGTTSTSRSLALDAATKAAGGVSSGVVQKAVNVLRGAISPLAGPAAIKTYIRMHNNLFEPGLALAVEKAPGLLDAIGQALIAPDPTKAPPQTPGMPQPPDVTSPWNKLQQFIGGQK